MRELGILSKREAIFVDEVFGDILDPGSPVSLRLIASSSFKMSSFVTETRAAITCRTIELIYHLFKLVSPLRWK